MARRRRVARTGGGVEAEVVDHLADNIARWIKVVAWVMGLTVVSYELLNAPLDRFTQDIDNMALMKVGLVIFFFGWLWGATNDTEIQRVGYCVDPKDAKLGLKEGAGIILFVAVFVTLFALHTWLVAFQAFLLVFILVNVVTWRIIFDRTREMIGASYEKFVAHEAESVGNCSLAKLLLVVQYMNGPWQRHRFITLVALAAVQLIVAIVVASGRLAPFAAGLSFHGVGGDVLLGYLPGILFILYVLISEIWMKIYRIKLFADINTIDYLEANFTISKQRDADLPRPHLAKVLDFSPSPNKNYLGPEPIKWLIDLI